LEKFESLTDEKQNAILNGAMTCFAVNGYKKASASDIAGAAGISKAMVFHYFGTKKALYLYLLQFCCQLMVGEIEEKADPTITDFFDRIKQATDIKLSVLGKHPAMLTFLESTFFEADEEVKSDVQAYYARDEWEEFRSRLTLEGLDVSKFKDTVDPALVLKMLVRYAYGYLNMTEGKLDLDIDSLMKEFEDCLKMLKLNLYKPEYL
jgi:AcrR family transcriptional regulator